MIKHYIMWNFREDMTPPERTEAAKKIKSGLEGLLGRIDGLVSIHVYARPLGTANVDLMLDSAFVSVEALKAYAVNPDHLAVAVFVRSVVSSRKCMDIDESENT